MQHNSLQDIAVFFEVPHNNVHEFEESVRLKWINANLALPIQKLNAERNKAFEAWFLSEFIAHSNEVLKNVSKTSPKTFILNNNTPMKNVWGYWSYRFSLPFLQFDMPKPLRDIISQPPKLLLSEAQQAHDGTHQPHRNFSI